MSGYEFDVEEYRADLVRRRDALRERERQYWTKWLSGKRENDFADSSRCAHKADGIDIALSLLPESKPLRMTEVDLNRLAQVFYERKGPGVTVRDMTAKPDIVKGLRGVVEAMGFEVGGDENWTETRRYPLTVQRGQ